MRCSALLLFGFLAACVPVPDPVPGHGDTPPSGQDLASCGGAELAGLIGGPVAALPATGGWGVLRVLHPGEPVTEDYSISRLNVEVDEHGRITGLSCG